MRERTRQRILRDAGHTKANDGHFGPDQMDRPSADAPIELRVAEALEQDGFEASYEYPGYVEVHHAGAVWAFGTANDTWGGHKLDADGDAVQDSDCDLNIPSDSRSLKSVALVVERIRLVITNNGLRIAVENDQLRMALTNLVNGVKELHPDASELGGLEEAEAILGKGGQ